MFAIEEPQMMDGPVVFFDTARDRLSLVETTESHVSENAILRNLAAEGVLWNVSWQAGSHNRTVYVEDGAILLSWLDAQYENYPRQRVHAEIDIHIDAIDNLCHTETRTPFLADLMTIVELSTSARLDVDWFETNQPCMIVNDPDETHGWPFEPPRL
ncbi:hypothetical protein [Nonomuraea typhae]|uniref:Uncharacterized protein n=1 Tax=Nonomuraea typhae TaxID=2603600 RepID=A0ABW7Z8A9_9ACTN